MVAEPQACPECDAPVRSGRLSCPSCGALLAAVEGRVAPSARAVPEGRPVGAASGSRAAAEPRTAPEAAAPTVATRVAPTVPKARREAQGGAPSTVAVRRRATTLRPPVVEPVAPPVDQPAASAPQTEARPVAPPAIVEAVPPPMLVDAVPPAPEPDPTPIPGPSIAAPTADPGRPIPGSYLPPSDIFRARAAAAPASRPATPLGDAHGAGARSATSFAPPTGHPAPAAPPTATRPPRAPVLDMPFQVAAGAGPKLVAIGAAMAVFSFVLPWIPEQSVVIGATPGQGLFARWGLAAIGNLVPLGTAVIVLVLATLPNRVPPWIVGGVLPLALGGALAAIGWIYTTSQFGYSAGIVLLLAAGILLVAGGVLVLRSAVRRAASTD